MRKHLLLLSVACLASTALFAGPRTPQQARQIANAAAQRQGAQLEAAPSAGAKANSNSQAQPYYIFNKANNKGFVIVSGDDELPEIIGETSQGSFDGSNTQLNDFLKNFANGVKKLQNNDPKTKAYAQALKARRAGEATDSIGPLIGTSWNQYSPYNVKCPATTNTTSLFGSHAASGCVATGMAQIMYYYKWPKQLKATIPAYTTSTKKYEIAEVTAGKTYQWDRMKKSYTQKDEEGMDVVGTLLADVGASVQMDYNDANGESTSFFTAPKTAFPTYWDYNASTLTQLYKSNMTLNTWDTYIYNEIKAKRPVLYADNSHCVVIEGYRSKDNKVYVNWGWGGMYNDWYDIDALMLDDESYMNNPSVYVGIIPNDGKSDTQLPTSILNMNAGGTLTASNTREMDDEDFNCTANLTFTNSSKTTDFNGSVALGIEDGRGFKLISDPQTLSLAASQTSPTVTFNFNYPFAVGSTLVYGMVSYDGTTWLPAGNVNLNGIEVTATEEQLTAATASFETSISAQSGVYDSLDINNSFKIVVEIKNNAKLLSVPSHYVYLYWQDSANEDNYGYVGNGYFSTGEIPGGQSKQYVFTINPKTLFKTAGKYYFYTYDMLTRSWGSDSQTFNITEQNAVKMDTTIVIAPTDGKWTATVGQPKSFTVTVKNDSESGTIQNFSMYVGYENEDNYDDYGYLSDNDDDLQLSTGNIAAGGTSTLTFTWTPEKEGNYYMFLEGDNNFWFSDDVVEVSAATGITNINSDVEGETAPWYTISGTRLNKKPAQPGIYVHNGKKVVVK